MWSSNIQFSPQTQYQQQTQWPLQNQPFPFLNQSQIMGQLMQQVVFLPVQQQIQPLQLHLERQQPVLATKKIYNKNSKNHKSDSPEKIFEAIKSKLISEKPLTKYMLDKISKMSSDNVINLRDSEGNTLLHIAAERLNSRVIRILLKKSANSNLLNNKMETPVKILSRNVHIDSNLKLEIMAIFNKFAKNNEINANKQSLKRKYNETNPIVFTSNKILKSDLVESAFNEIKTVMLDEKTMPTKKFEKFKSILTDEIVNFKDSDGNTLLHIAAKTSSLIMIGLLFENSANNNILNNEGDTPSQIAIKNNQIIPSLKTKVISIFSKYVKNDGSDVLKYAFEDIKKSLIEGVNGGLIYRIVQSISDNPELVKLKDSDGNTLLHIAALFPAPQIVKALLENLADLNIANNSGRTPLQMACDSDGSSHKSSKVFTIFAEYSENGKKDTTNQSPLIEQKESSFSTNKSFEDKSENWINNGSFETEYWLNDEIDLGFEPNEVDFQNEDDNINERLGLYFY